MPMITKISAVFAFLEKDIQNKTTVNLSEEQLAIIDKEHEMHLIEQTKFHTRREAHQFIKTSR
jgi:hypothetical protein